MRQFQWRKEVVGESKVKIIVLFINFENYLSRLYGLKTEHSKFQID